MHWFREKFVLPEQFGKSVAGRPLTCIRIGMGERRLMMTACHHANEVLTGLCLWGMLEAYAEALAAGALWAVSLYAETTLTAVPWVNPDGAALLLGLAPEEERARMASLSPALPRCPFPEGWKANGRGVDLNLNYPARWEGIRERKGVFGQAPRDYAGPYPLSEPEAAALKALTQREDPSVVAALHSQGEEIYANFGSLRGQESRMLEAAVSRALGYPVLRTPKGSDAGGYKDWFIETFDRPGFTVELGLGENPLPLRMLPALTEKTLRLLRALGDPL